MLSEINLCSHLRLNVIAPDNRGEDRLDTLLVIRFHFAGVFELRRLHRLTATLGQQASALIDDGNVIGIQPRHCAGNQIRDRIHLPGIQRASVLQRHGDRRRRWLLFADKHRRFWHSQMHAGILYRAERFNGAGKFPLQRTLVVNLLTELADAKFFLIEQFETHGAALRQTELGEGQPCFVNFILRYHDRPAAFLKAVRHIHLR